MKIICIGRNYADHVAEFRSERPEVPVFFMKPDTALVKSNKPVYIPDFTQELHYELELVVKICKVGKYIQEKFAHTYWDELGLGIDLTARDLQRSQSAKGLPWEIAKSFEGSAPVSSFFPKSQFGDGKNVNFHLDLNGKTVQTGNSDHMIFSIDQIISYVSRFFTLKQGDLIFTGTPSGVGPLAIGDLMEAYLEGEKVLKCKVK